VLLGAVINYGMNGPTNNEIENMRKASIDVAGNLNIMIFINFLSSSLYVPPIATAVVGLSLFTLHPELNPLKLF
jgi:hypothetical protein